MNKQSAILFSIIIQKLSRVFKNVQLYAHKIITFIFKLIY